MTIDDATFVICDTESTGLKYAEGHRMVEFAGKIHPNGNALSFLVNPGRSIPHEASGVHGIIDEDVANGLTLAEADEAILDFVPPDAIMVWHNAEHDRQMLPAIANRRFVCTERLAHHLDPESSNFKLGTLRYRYGHARVDTGGLSAHRAMADVLVTQRVFMTLLAMFRNRYPTASADDLVAFSASPYPIRRMAFGAHVGKTLDLLPESYLGWGIKNLDPDIRFNFERELDRRRGRMSFAS